MSAIRQKRKSCEACRARKLKCSGKETGCSRCVHLGLACRFHEKGIPGRPRKWSLTDTTHPLRASPSRQYQLLNRQQHQQPMRHHTSARVVNTLSSEPRSADMPTHSSFVNEVSSSTATSNTIDTMDIVTLEPQGWTPQGGDVDFAGIQTADEALSFLDFNTIGQLDSLPLDSFRACLSHDHREAGLTTHLTSPPPSPQSCDCSRHVFDTIRALNDHAMSHGILVVLRQGTTLFENLLNCPLCYDMSQPPRVTLQNVLLIGRLTFLILMRYRAYFQWLKDHYANSNTENTSEAFYLSSGATFVDISIGRDRLYDIVKEGLKNDAARLVELGRKFEKRQKNRHLIGHEACPDADGQCWREKSHVDPDPSDVCPQNHAARTLIPCYRVVDEVRAKIKMFEDSLAQG